MIFPKENGCQKTQEEKYILEVDEWLCGWSESENTSGEVNFVERKEEYLKYPWVNPYKIGESDFDEMEREDSKQMVGLDEQGSYQWL